MTIEEEDIWKKGLTEYQILMASGLVPKNYPELARRADLVTEECLRQMSSGSMGVQRDGMYRPVFDIIFKDMLESTIGGKP